VVKIEREEPGVVGIALSATAGIVVGVLGGMLLREFLVDVNTAPVRNAVRRLRRPAEPRDDDPQAIRRAVEAALADDPHTERLGIGVDALGEGIVELTGLAPDATTRQLAGELARTVPGADVVVNRILVEGSDSLARIEPEAG